MRVKYIQKLASMVDYYAQFHPQALSMKRFIDFGSKTGCEKSSFDFLRHELPVRMSQIMKEIEHLPENLLRMPSVQLVRGWYDQSLEEIIDYESSGIDDHGKLIDFADTLVKIRNRHANVVETMAQGVIELKESHPIDEDVKSKINIFLDRFYTNRIGIRVLINQHILLYGSQLTNHPHHVGCIDPNCDVVEVVKDAFEKAKFLCEQYYLISPDVDIITHNPYEMNRPINIVYVPSHLYHILFEVLKNAMRAVVETHSKETEVPKIKVLICKGQKDLTIKVSDQGGGVPYNKVHKLFEYMYSTAPTPNWKGDGTAPLAGYGYGLPLSRIYARYFKGDLVLSSVEGYGTDAFVYLKVLSNEANECIPVYNKTSSKMYDTHISSSDWTQTKR